MIVVCDLVKETIVKPVAMTICLKCKTESREGAKFCAICGHDLRGFWAKYRSAFFVVTRFAAISLLLVGTCTYFVLHPGPAHIKFTNGTSYPVEVTAATSTEFSDNIKLCGDFKPSDLGWYGWKVVPTEKGTLVAPGESVKLLSERYFFVKEPGTVFLMDIINRDMDLKYLGNGSSEIGSNNFSGGRKAKSVELTYLCYGKGWL
jgi:hypothetical protein